ncbi:hypothetical protein CDL12_05736 [Handroanthus impetiginosus]|uniref:Uncharacterized protein n=1 Tax=Handroanthus impetiginosus TaxID=429701 RepID=A0A2G9HVL4_9LAMI|nr:hypothetical protein CDL12_05736 [Handroanthus impetiginosus]
MLENLIMQTAEQAAIKKKRKRSKKGESSSLVATSAPSVETAPSGGELEEMGVTYSRSISHFDPPSAEKIPEENPYGTSEVPSSYAYPSSKRTFGPTPNQTWFTSNSVLRDDLHELGRDFLLGLAPGSLISRFESMHISSEEKLRKWESKAEYLQKELNEQRHLGSDLELLRKNHSELQEHYERLNANYKELEQQHIQAARRHAEELNRTRIETETYCYQNFPNTEKGRIFMETFSEKTKSEFKKSLEHRKMLAEEALKFYYHGFKVCKQQVEGHGLRPPSFTLEFLNKKIGLRSLPKSGDPIEDSSEEGEGYESEAGSDDDDRNAAPSAQNSEAATLATGTIPTSNSALVPSR